MEDKPVIRCGGGVRLHCERVDGQRESEGVLFRIRDWKNISLDSSFYKKPSTVAAKYFKEAYVYESAI